MSIHLERMEGRKKKLEKLRQIFAFSINIISDQQQQQQQELLYLRGIELFCIDFIVRLSCVSNVDILLMLARKFARNCYLCT